MNNQISLAINHFEEQIKSYSIEFDSDPTLLNFTITHFRSQILQINSLNLEEHYNKQICNAYQKTKNIDILHDFLHMLEKESELRKRHLVRENMSLSKIQRETSLTKIYHETSLKTTSSSNLILMYLQRLCFYHESENYYTGTLRYQIRLIQDSKDIEIVLLSISDVKPRDKNESCDFIIELSMHPVNTKNGSKKCTPVYYKKTHHLFDLEEKPNVTNDEIREDRAGNTFIFPLREVDPKYSSENNKFIEFRLYDKSQIKIRKYLLGHFFVPLENITRCSSKDVLKDQNDETVSVDHFRNYELQHIFNLDCCDTLKTLYNEIKTRQDDYSRLFKDTMEFKMEKYSTF